MRNGIGISGIQLWIFGGMARMDREADTPGTELKVALAGPGVTLAIVVVLALVGMPPPAGPSSARRRSWKLAPMPSPGLMALVAWLVTINAPRPRLQLAAGLPDGRGPRCPCDRLVAHR